MRKPQSQELNFTPVIGKISVQLSDYTYLNIRRLCNLSVFNILQKTFIVTVILSFLLLEVRAQIASAPANTKSPWVNGTYTNLVVSSADNTSLIPPRTASVSNTANIINASTADFATVSITGIGGVASISVKDNDAADTYPAGTFAGFRVGSSSLLSATLASTVTIRTYNNNTLAETYNAVASLVDVGSLLLNSDGTATLGFITKQPFDEIEIEYGALVGLVFTADVYNAVIERFVVGPALSCNVQTTAANPVYPTYINSDGTGVSGVACAACSVTDAENVVSASTSDFATISMAVSLGSTGSLAVRDAITTYPAGTFTGFNIANPGLINANLLSGISIETYKTTTAGVRTLVETSTSGSLLSVGTFLSGSGAQTVGFVTTQPFDEVRIVMSNLLGVLSTTNVYNAVFQQFCAGPTPTCTANTNLINPAYPVVIDGTKSGIGGVACVACSVNNSQNVIDSDLSNSASIVLAAGVLANGSIAVKDQLTTYVPGTFAGFDIENSSLIGVNLFGGVTITTYLAGAQQETSGGNLISLQLLSSSRQVVGFSTTLPFDELRITVGNFASVSLGSTIVYSAVLKGPSAAGHNPPIFTSTTLSNSCPATTVSLAGLTNTGTKPAGASLIWSTNRVPTSAGDTLTNLTTVSAAGKYYAMYYDKVEGCYSQADSVTVTINSCNSPLCNLSLPVLLPLGSSKILPVFCVKGSFDYYKDSLLNLTNYLAISPNGNTFAPISINIDATPIGIYTRTNLGNTTTLATRMIHIEAPGTYSVNGGMKVRIYYEPSEFITLPTAYRTWFKHTAHVKATVLGDLTATGLNNSIAITPDSTGTENGVAFVQFNNITNFSTFGFMGSTGAPCIAGTDAPIISATTLTNTCPTTTVDLSSLPNTGTQPSGTTLVWSMNKVPTSAGDTLTNLTTVSTAGKYYVMYFDQAGNCYSPADSVEVTLAGCGVVTCNGTNILAGTIAPTTGFVADNYTVNSQLSIQSLSAGGGYTDANTGYRFGTPTATTDRNYKLVFSSPVTNVVLHLGFINNDILINSPAPAGEEAIANITAVGAPGAVYTFQDFSVSGMQNIWNSTTRTISSSVNSFGPNSNSKIQISSATPFTEITLTHDYIAGTNPFGVLLEDVCYELACVAGTVAPSITQTTATNICPVTTVDLSALANTGIQPAGTTLIWSTNKVPTSAGDTLTNLTTVSTAGKYYALYFDKVNNCYSPADSVDVTITPCPPVANADNLTATVGVSTTLTVLINDTNSDGTPVTDLTKITLPTVPLTGVGAPTKGVVLVNANGTITYTPTVGSTGTDTFIYTICDRINTTVCDTALVTMTINPAPCVAGTVAPIIVPTTATNTCPTTTVDLSALANTGTKPSGTTLIWSTNKVPTSAGDTLTNLTTVSTAGKYYALYFDKVNNCYSPADSVDVTITPCPPVANADNLTATVGVSTTLTVLINDTNSDGTPVTDLTKITLPTVPLTGVGAPTKGVVLVNANGTITYTPTVGSTGTDTFIYTICDRINTTVCDTALVTMTINPAPCVAGTVAPIIVPLTATNTCPTTTVDLSALANTGTKPAGTTLIWSTNKVPTSAGDTLTNLTTVSTAGKYYALYFDKVNNCYSPADSVDVTITPCPPVANADNLTATVGVSTTLTVLINDTNSDGTPVTDLTKITLPTVPLTGVGVPTKGVVLVNANGTITYTPTVGSTGTDTFIYTICDRINTTVCDTALVTMTINPAPCVAGTVAPIIVPLTATNTCPTTTVDLSALANTGTKPAGTTLIWSTNKVPTSAGDTLTNLTTVSTAGKYYALYFDKVNNCYSPADSVVVSLTVCTVTPPAQVAITNQPKTGTASTELTPTGGVGPYIYSVDNSLACTPVIGATALPLSSNLTVTNASMGAYTYTAPAIAGTYYYCIKVCDSTTPTANCTTKTYTLTVTNPPCLAGILAPIIVPTTATNICPITTVSLAGLANTGIQPAGTTLIWSTNKVPTSAGDTLTNLTTVSTAGKYYALYFDKVNNCYSPADSVVVTITPCCNVTIAPVLSRTTATNICPALTANLSSITANNTPLGTTLTWHTATPATLLNEISPTAVITGITYYAAFKGTDGTNTCYGATTPVTVTTSVCLPNTYSVICPQTSFNLMAHVDSTSKPAGALVSWHSGTPATSANRVLDPTQVTVSGTYYASYSDLARTCFGATTTALTLNVVSCPPTLVTNTCPDSTVNLMTHVDSTNKPVGTVVSWHSGTPATLSNKIADPTQIATSGTYYLCYFDPMGDCYGGTATLQVNIIPCCNAGNNAPIIAATTLTNICPVSTVNLAGLIDVGIKPVGTNLVWSTNKVPTSSGDTLTNLTAVSTAGKYYALYFDKVNNCFSPADSVDVPLTVCPPVCTTILPVLLPLGLSRLLPVYCIGGSFNYYKSVVTDLNNFIAISPNGNSFSPVSIMVDASLTGVHAKSTQFQNTVVANRMAMIEAPGTFTVNGGIKVRIYYDSTEFINLPTQYRTWFKHPAHVKSQVLADLTESGITNAVAITPDSTGVENGVTFVQFNNVQNFSTFGYVGSSTCLAGAIAPDITPIAATNTCPTKTVDLTALPNAGTIPSGTRLVWSTNSVPTSLGDTLTNTTTVSTAGKYYALYFDETNSCFGPADSVNITITDCNLPPVIVPVAVVTTTGKPVTQCMTVTDPNVGDVLTPTLCTPSATNGTVSNPTIVAGKLCFTYTPNPGFTGTDAICVKVCDQGGLCDQVTIPVTVAPTPPPTTVPAPPVIVPVVLTTPKDNPVTVCVPVNDPNTGDVLTPSLCTPEAANGTISTPLTVVNGTVCITYTPNTGFTGTDAICLKVCDQTGLCTQTSIPVTVVATPDSLTPQPPIVVIAPVVTPTNKPITVCGLVNDPNGDGPTTASVCTTPTAEYGTVTAVSSTTNNVCFTYTPDPEYTGTDMLCIRVCDATGLCVETKVPVLVTPIPLAVNDINVTLFNKPVSGSVATNDTKIAATDVFTTLTSPLNGGIVFNPDGTYTYTPTTGFVGKDSVQYKLCTVDNNCSIAWLYLTVYKPEISVNLPPIAQNDVAQTNVNTPVAGLLANNDFDPENGALRYNTTPVTNPAHGTVTINTNGTYTYTPDLGYIGNDTFTYQVCDELNQCTTATVTVYVRPDNNGPTANDAPNAQDDSYRTTMNVPVTGNVRLNDSDPNGNTLSASVTSTTTNGTIVLNANGTFTYTPTTGYYGNDQFRYKVCDPAGLCDTATVYLVVTPPATDAEIDVNITAKNTPVSGNVLTNDNGGGLALTLNTTPIVQPKNGTFVLSANGSYTYTPANGFVGKDSARYVVCNAAAFCDSAWVTINVIDPIVGQNDAPIASDDAAQTLKDTPVKGKVTNNDIDPDGDVLTASVLKQPANGTLVLSPDGTYTYTPNPGYTGRDKFQYQVCDANGACDTACVVITVTPDLNGTTANDKPNAQDDAGLTQINVSVTGSLRNNDTDPNGNNLTYTTTPVTAPANGTATITAAGTYTYTPATGYYGPDQFKYRVCDTGSPSLCDTATVYIMVLPPVPDAQNDINVTIKNKPVTGSTATNDNGNGLAFTTNTALVVQPLHGTLTLAANGDYIYTPATGYVGKDSAQYVICNVAGKCDSAWIFVSILPDPLINGNNEPVAQNDVAQTLINTPVSGKVTNNDIDPDGNPLTATLTSAPENGTLVLNPNGTFTYTPDAGFVGTDKFCYKACDPAGLCDTACVTITVSPDLNGTANDKPNAQDDAALTTMNTPVTGQLKPNDSDPNGNLLTYTATPIVAPLNGTVTISPTTGQFVYTPTTGYTGTDKFLYRVCDNGTPSLCDTATVYLTVVPPTNNPDAINDINVTFKNTPVSGSVLTNDETKGQVVTTTILPGFDAKNGTLTLSPTGTYTYVPNANFVGKDSAKYVLCNAISICDTAWIYLTTIPYPPSSIDNNKPVANNDVATTNQGVPVSGSVGNNDIDPDLAQTLTFAKLTDPTPTQGTVTFNLDGTFTFTPAPNFVGNATFKYKVCDNGTPSLCDTASVTIEVKPQSTQPNDKPVANDDAFLTYQGVGINGNAAPNDSDPNGNTLAFAKVTNPANGTVIMNANGTFSYAPNATFIGTDSFTYKICDNGTPSLCDTATVYLTVEPPKQPTANVPDAVNDIAMTLKNTSVTDNVLTNDDSKGNPLVVGLPSGVAPQNGVLSFNPDGSFIYTPTNGYVGKDSVKYVICVNETPLTRCDTAFIYFNIIDVPSAQNDKPIANNDVATTEAGTPVKGNVLANDVDPDLTDILTASKLTEPAHGTVTVNPDGSYTYTPTPGYVGKDYFTYKVCDNGVPVKCDSAKVEIDVTPVVTPLNANTKPAAQDDALLTKVNTPKSGTVATNDTDPNAGQILAYTKLSDPTNGTLTFNPDGTYTYTPTTGFVGNDSFKYKVCDNGTPVLCDSATVIITVEPNNKISAPVAQNDIAVTSPSTPVIGNVLVNDDGKGNPLTATKLTDPVNGTLTLNPNGTFTYTPDPNYVGRDSAKYVACNSLIPAECDTAWVYFNTIPYPTLGNDKPVAMPDNAVTQSGSPVTSSVLGNDYDPDKGQTLTASKVSDPANGTVTVNPNGTYTYTPAPGFVGTDVFKYKVCDNGTPSLCDTTTVTIKVTPIDPTVPANANLKPDAGDDVVVSTGGQPVTASVIGNDRDPNAGQTLTYTLLSQPAKGTVTLSPTGDLVWTPVIDPALPGATYFVKYRVCDNGSPVLCDTATVELRSQPSVTQPDAQDDIAVAKVNTPTTGNVLTNDDEKGLPVTATLVTPAKNGTFALNPDGTYTYTPTAGFVGTDSVKYKICNNQVPVECDSAWVTISVIPDPIVGVNDKPVASNDVTQTNAGVPVNGNASTNDFDPDLGQTLAFTKLTNPTNGTATMNPDGTFTYTPNAGFTGTDSFTYKVCDNGTPVLCDTAKVVITVEPVTPNPAVNEAPVAVDDVVAGVVGKPVTYNVGGNDKDPEGTPLTFAKLGGNPNVTIDPAGNVTYTPAIDPITGQPLGGNTVTYKVCDTGSPVKCDTATIYLTVSPSPTQVLAVNDINTTLINTTVTGNVITNDDAKGLPIVASLLTPAKNGILTLNPDGTYGYIPTTNFAGKDSVQYQICNNQTPAECSNAWLYITVIPAPTTANDKPFANPDVAQTLVNTPVSGKVTNNDIDPEGAALTATKLTNPTNGTVTLNPDGTFTYTPNPGFTGKDKFTYKVCDAGVPVLCDTASVVIDVQPKLTPIGANDKPNAQDDAIATNIGTPKTATVAPNDTDPNAGQVLAYAKVTDPVHGTVTVNADGTYTYTPAAGYTGPDKFTYKVCDNGTPSLCDTATVYIDVLPLPVPVASAPLAINDINIVPKNTTATGNVLTNDENKGLPVTTTLITPAKNGVLTLNLNGTYTYVPTTDYVGKDSAQYQLCNNKVPAECDTAWIYLNVQDAPIVSPTNNEPTAMQDVNQTLVNKPVSGTVATNDFDPDLGQTLVFSKLTNPTNGTVVFNANGTYTYTPANNFVGTDVFTYQVCDNQTPALCDQTSVTIKVSPDYSGGGNIKPVANDDAFTTNKGIGFNGKVNLNDNDPNVGQTLTFTQVSIPANGTVNFNADGSFSYTPNATFVGTDQFLYKTCDNGTPTLCDTATVYISVKEPVANVCVNFNIKVMLEGPLNTVSNTMSNFLNVRGLLPGQTPVGASAVATPDGQPYSGAPWNYAGTEKMPIGGYAADIVDWVLISLRTDSLTTTPAFRAAGLLHADGTVSFVNPCFTVANGSYYILVEHRNHLGVMSDKKITVTSGVITYDFTTKDSYALTNPPSYGQKLLGTKYVMYAADHKKALQNDNYDINAADSNLWKGQSGIFDRYMSGDYNFDADVNNADNTLWKLNNGRFSGVPH